MTETYEQKQIVLNAMQGMRITGVNIIDGGKSIEIYASFDKETFDKMFPIVDVESMSQEDSFMRHKPTSERQKRVYDAIVRAKKNGMKNFRAPVINPSFADDGKTIIYKAGREPAFGKSATWWKRALADFMPIKNSRMGTQTEYDVFLGTIIKYLIEEKKYEVETAWYAVCENSRDLPHYKEEERFMKTERTGYGFIGKWADLLRAFKYISDDDDNKMWIVSVDSFAWRDYSLAEKDHIRTWNNSNVGWMVMDV